MKNGNVILFEVVAYVIMERENPGVYPSWPRKLSALLQQCWSYEAEDRPSMLDCLNRLMHLRGMREFQLSENNSSGLYAVLSQIKNFSFILFFDGESGSSIHGGALMHESAIADSWNATQTKHQLTNSESNLWK